MATPTTQEVKTAKMVMTVIDELQDGASKDAISQHIETRFAVPNKQISKYLTKAINKGIAFGAIKKLRGRYHPGEAMEGIREHRRRGRRRRGRSGRRRRRRRRH